MAEEKKHEVSPAVPNRVQSAEHARNVWVITAESSEHPEDFLAPEFYAHIAKNMRPYDHIEIRTDDCTYWAELLVTSSDRTWAKVQLLREVRLESDQDRQQIDDRYTVQWKGPHRKWAVIRTQDKSIVHEGEQERAAANAWLTQYLRTVGRKAA